MLVDAHLHIWRAMASYPNPGGTIVSPLSDVPLELLTEYLDEHHVDRAVLVQPLYPGEDNSYIAACTAAQPERLAAVCVVDPRAAAAPDRLEYWVRERGCRGLRLRPRVPAEGAVFGAASTFPLWERCRALKVVVNVLMDPEHLRALAALAERFPEVPVVIDHMGHPDVTAGVGAPDFQALLALARRPNVHVKITGHYYYSRQPHPFQDCWDYVRAVYDHFGAARLIWGSDFPHVLLKVGYRRSLHLPKRAFGFLSDADRALAMGQNAARLYWPGPPGKER